MIKRNVNNFYYRTFVAFICLPNEITHAVACEARIREVPASNPGPANLIGVFSGFLDLKITN